MDIRVVFKQNLYKIKLIYKNNKKISLSLRLWKFLKIGSNLFLNTSYLRRTKRNLMYAYIFIILKNGGLFN